MSAVIADRGASGYQRANPEEHAAARVSKVQCVDLAGARDVCARPWRGDGILSKPRELCRFSAAVIYLVGAGVRERVHDFATAWQGEAQYAPG
jgi:hypothetical protein